MNANIDKDAINSGYQDVRNDSSETNWIVIKPNEDNVITVTAQGKDFEDFRSNFGDEDRGFGYIRMVTGDELSHRCKFAFVQWIGPKVSPLKRARSSTEKGAVKVVVQNFAVECMFGEEGEEFSEDFIREKLIKAGGANYGTGKRD